MLTELGQMSSRKFAEIGKRFLQPCGVPFAVEHDQVQMCRHDNKCVHAKMLLLMTEAKAIGNDLARALAHENGQPICDAEGAEIERSVRMDSVSLHGKEDKDWETFGQSMCAVRRPAHNMEH